MLRGKHANSTHADSTLVHMYMTDICGFLIDVFRIFIDKKKSRGWPMMQPVGTDARK